MFRSICLDYDVGTCKTLLSKGKFTHGIKITRIGFHVLFVCFVCAFVCVCVCVCVCYDLSVTSFDTITSFYFFVAKTPSKFRGKITCTVRLICYIPASQGMWTKYMILWRNDKDTTFQCHRVSKVHERV